MKIDPEAAHRAMGFWHRIRRLVKLRPFTRRGVESKAISGSVRPAMRLKLYTRLRS
jgi:hypothetical protein